jgi:hypothetical protein
MRPAFRTGPLVADSDLLAAIPRPALVAAIVRHATSLPDPWGAGENPPRTRTRPVPPRNRRRPASHREQAIAMNTKPCPHCRGRGSVRRGWLLF